MSGLGRALLTDALAPGVLVLTAVTGVGAVLLSAQALVVAPVVPGLLGALSVSLGFLPVALGAGLPAAALAGVVSAARSWREGGELVGLASAGLGARRLLPAVLVAGLGLAFAQAMLTAVAEPMGRRAARGALVEAVGDLTLRAGEPVEINGALLRARDVSAGRWSGIFIAENGRVATARRGRVEGGRVLILEEGTARDVSDDGWQLDFTEARIPLEPGARRVEHAERSTRDLLRLVQRMGREHRDASYETLILYKRLSMPLAMPALMALGLALGAAGARPAPVALAVLVGWWSAIRLTDQWVASLGPSVAAGLPVALLVALAVVAWLRWEGR